MANYSFQQLPFAYGKPLLQGRLRSLPEDFVVIEDLGFEPSGQGEHVLLQIKKRNTNTEWLARQLAHFAGVRQVDIGYAGLKDRHAVTTQWFSVHLPKRQELAWQQLETDDLQIIRMVHHQRKLQRGCIKKNLFQITLRQLQGDTSDVEGRLQQIKMSGVPNYFAEQRFGHNMNNLQQADALFKGLLPKAKRHERGIYLSAVRSWLFNCILAARIQHKIWNQALPGDVLMLNGTQSIFKIDEVDQTIIERISQADIHPTGPLWGTGPQLSQKAALALETEVLESYDEWRSGLELAGLKQERRSLRLMVSDLNWQFLDAETLFLQFSLAAGSYATAVLRELILPQCL